MACRYCGRQFNGGKATCQSCAAPWSEKPYTATDVIRDREAFFNRKRMERNLDRAVNPVLVIDNVVTAPGSICTVGGLQIRDWRTAVRIDMEA